MRIAIDARAYSWAGIGRYTRSLLRALLAQDSPHSFVAMSGAREADRIREELPSPRLAVVSVEDAYYSWAEQTKLLWQLNRIEADLFHFMHFNVPILFRRPYIATIHDTTRFLFPGQKKQNLFQQLAYEYVFTHTVKAAQEIICVSETTQQAVLALPGVKAAGRPLSVIYEGVEDIFFEPVSQENQSKLRMLLGTSDPFVLYVGVWMSHKNLPRLLEAFREVSREFPHLKLVMTGKPKPGYDNMLRLTQDLQLHDKVIFAGFVPDYLLPALYAESRGLLLPSLYEGFGLPALEAAAAGAPVIAANCGALPEILGEGAEYVNPTYVPDIAAVTRKILAGEARHLAARAKARAAEFSWEKCAAQTLAVYAKNLL